MGAPSLICRSATFQTGPRRARWHILKANFLEHRKAEVRARANVRPEPVPSGQDRRRRDTRTAGYYGSLCVHKRRDRRRGLGLDRGKAKAALRRNGSAARPARRHVRGPRDIDPLRSFTCIDLSSKRGVTRPKTLGPVPSEGPVPGGEGNRPNNLPTRRTPRRSQDLGGAPSPHPCLRNAP